MNRTPDIRSQYWAAHDRHLVGGILGVFASILVGAAGNQSNPLLARLLMLTGIGVSGGYIAGATFSGAKFERYADLLEQDWSQRFSTLQTELDGKLQSAIAIAQSSQAELEKTRLSLSQTLEQLRKADLNQEVWSARARLLGEQLAEYRERFDTSLAESRELLEREYAAARVLLETEQAEVRAALEIEFAQNLKQTTDENYHHYLAKIKERNAEHRRRERFLLTELESVVEQHQAQWQDAAQKYEALLDEYEQVLNSYHPELEQIQNLFNQRMGSLVEERDRVYAQLATYHAAKRFMGSTKADINGNRLIDFFLARGITCDADHCLSHFEYDEVWIRPRGVTPEEMEKHTSSIQLQFELLAKPSFSVDQGCVRVIMRTHTKEKSASTNVIDEKPENWLEEVVIQSHHYRIAAPTDRGKSVFLDNLINCMKRVHGDEFQLTLLDPKYPFTDWNGHQPDHEGFEECLKAMQGLADQIETRIEQAKTDVKAGRPIRNYPAHLFAIDELELMVDEARAIDNRSRGRGKVQSEVSRILRKGLKVGRGLTTRRGKGILVAYVTQSPLCSRIGLNKDDFDNSTNIFIGENIAIALAQELDDRLPPKQLAYLNKQYELRLERGDQYFALIKSPKEAFLATLPAPGYFASLSLPRLAEFYPNNSGDEGDASSTLELLSSGQSDNSSSPSSQSSPTDSDPRNSIQDAQKRQEKCPQCASTKFVKNGKKRGIQYYRCSNCRHQFQVG
ncbi:MAG: hypothetical protein MUC48_27495 [Leptolyngbya sp. Prado105]|nr:hypothetical protein [Leptolyngbya sp. Prado105]